MNEVYKSDTMTVHDDREFISAEDAFSILTAGGTIEICDPPNFTSEDEHEIHPMPWSITMNDIPTEYRTWPAMIEYFRSYELSK